MSDLTNAPADWLGEFSPLPTIREMVASDAPAEQILAYIDGFVAATSEERAHRQRFEAALEHARQWQEMQHGGQPLLAPVKH